MSEPRTEAGKRLLDWLYLNGGAFRTEDRDHIEAAILAIEAEAAMQSSPVDLRALLEELLEAGGFPLAGQDMTNMSKAEVEQLWIDADTRWIKACNAARAALRAVPAEAEEDLTDIPAADMTTEQYEAWLRAGHPAVGPVLRRPADASGGGEGLDVVRRQLLAMPLGPNGITSAGWNRYDTDNEHVLTMWLDTWEPQGRSWDIRVPKIATPPAPTPASEDELRAAAQALLWNIEREHRGCEAAGRCHNTTQNELAHALRLALAATTERPASPDTGVAEGAGLDAPSVIEALRTAAVVHVGDPDDRFRAYNDGFDEGWRQAADAALTSRLCDDCKVNVRAATDVRGQK